MEDKEITFEIKKRIGTLSEREGGWRKELNLVAWNGREPKLDIRDWPPDHARAGKGLTLTRDEGAALAVLLTAYAENLVPAMK